MDYITVDDLSVYAVHGHYPHERNVEQEFLVSLTIGIDARPAGQSDKLPDTLDYDEVRRIVEETFAGEKRYLIEALAESIATRLLRDTCAREVRIAIKKTAVWPQGVPGVVITRSK